MGQTLPLRIFYPLSEIGASWGVARSELYQWLNEGILNAHLWFPLSSFYQIEEEIQGNRIIQTRTLCHREGYLRILSHDYRRLTHEGKTFLREFGSPHDEERYALPETVPSLLVQLDQLVILSEERLRFEDTYQLSGPSAANQGDFRTTSKIPPTLSRFRKVTFQGEDYTFGTIQATLLGLLFETAKRGNPWMNGKQLLARAGSLSFSVSNLFKRKPGWRNLIQSDGLGNYQINPAFLESAR